MAVLPTSDLPSIVIRSQAASSDVAASIDEASPSFSTPSQTPFTTPVLNSATTSTSKSLSIGAKAGIAISVTIICLSIVGILIFFAVRHNRRRRKILQKQALRRESERGWRNVVSFQQALPPHFLECEDTTGPPKPPPKPPKPVAKPPTKRGFSWMNEKEVVPEWRANMSKRFSRWRDRPGLDDFDPQLKKLGSPWETSNTWV
jgi:hypothetical protein